MPCPICTGALISTVAQSAAAVSLAKHVKDRTSKKPKSKSKQLKKKTDSKVAQYCDDNLEVGKKIKGLIEEGKIRLGKMDKNFILEVETVA
jgi:hypothetical protein